MSTTVKKRTSDSTSRTQRADGAVTRQRLLDTAGQVFAERGYADATSKEICERAGVPLASVNYHFGSRDALYEAVLIEGHRQLIALDTLVALAKEPGDAKQRLGVLIGRLVAVAGQADTPWGFRVVLREMLAPSQALPALVEKGVAPKSKLLLALMGEVLNLPPDHPAVQRGLLFAFLPCLVMILAPKQGIGRILPATAKDPGVLAEDYLRYVMAGLDAMALGYKSKDKGAGRR